MQRIYKNLTLSIPTISQLYLFLNFICVRKLRFRHFNIKHRMKYSALFIFSVSILINICCINIIIEVSSTSVYIYAYYMMCRAINDGVQDTPRDKTM